MRYNYMLLAVLEMCPLTILGEYPGVTLTVEIEAR